MPAMVQQSLLDLSLAGGILALALGTAALLTFLCARMGSVFADAVRPHANKLASLEGLRGILALSVAAHHTYCWYAFTQTGEWSTGNSIIFERFAYFGVMQFFYISGFLFWRKLMKKGSIEYLPFYLSRFVRIAPVYYVCIGIAICVGLSVTGLSLQVSASQLFGSLAAWAFFTIGTMPTINGADVLRITSGVVWTLACEWVFYLALPFFGWFSRKAVRILHLAFLMLVVFAVSKFLSSGRIHTEFVVDTFLVIRQFAKFMLIGFGGGIVLATFDGTIRERLRLSNAQRNWLVVAAYAFYLLVPGFRGFTVIGQLCLFAGFALVIQGADLFGFLRSRPVRFLGIISYDLYLVHGIVYYTAMRLRGGIHAVAMRTYIAETAACIVVIVLISTVLHFLVERPSMRLSESIAHRSPAQGGAGLPAAVVGT